MKAQLLSFLRVSLVATMAVVLVTQAPVQAQQTTMATNEVKQLTAKIEKEIDRRLAETKEAKAAIASTKSLDATTKKEMSAAIDASEKALKALDKELASVKTVAQAEALAKKVDAQYDQYAGANATGKTAKTADTQGQAGSQLQNLNKDMQSVVDKAGSSGADVKGLQEQVKVVKQLLESITAILKSVVALIDSLIMGNFTDAAMIFQTIAGQLEQTQKAIDTARNMSSSVIGSVNNLEITGKNGTKVSL